MPIEISAADVSDAEEFLASVVSEQVPAGRFTDGTALRDLTIKALAVVTAQLRKENNTVQALGSLKRIREIAASTTEAELDPAVADAADANLSNWFLSRGSGDFSRGVVQVYVSRKQDYYIKTTTRFSYDRALGFFPDSSTDVVISAASLFPVLDARGAVVAYFFTLRLVAGKTGTEYNVFPGTWQGNGGFSPYVMRVSHSARFEGGKSKQTTLEMIDAAPNAISVRNLINDRSIQATLPDKFKYVQRMVNIGMGDPEMQRDVTLDLGLSGKLHAGGHFDTYLELAVTESVFEGIVGGVYLRPDGIANVFTDSGVADWTTTNVLAGDVLRGVGGMSDTPRDYVISEVTEGELHVAVKRPFTESVGNVSYYIYRPLFGPDVQIYPSYGTRTTGITSATVQTSNRIVLPAEPHYKILDVAITNPGSDPYVNDPDGYVHFTSRVNTTPVMPAGALSDLPFQVIGRSPADGQSSKCFDEIVLPAGYNGLRARVRYQTLAGFSAVDNFMRDRVQRVLGGSVQPKGMHPVYLRFTVPYRLSPLATTPISELRIRQALVAYINSFDPRDVIDVSDVTTYIRSIERNIGSLFPFEIQYTLYLPDGRLVDYSTQDVVSVTPDKIAQGATFNPTASDLLQLTVSDRTTRYLTTLSSIYLEAR